MIQMRMTAALERAIQKDLKRPHKFAHERVGFLRVGLSVYEDHVILLARDYCPVDDEHYIDDPKVGAMIGPTAMYLAMKWAFETDFALFHIHAHGGVGVPDFSGVDVRESNKFVPDFFKVRPDRPHGAIVLSSTHARGRVWLTEDSSPQSIDCFNIVGAQLKKWFVR
jgi:hypothetical protein